MGNWIKVLYVRNHINLKIDYWKYPEETNCYAFSLGLDIPEKEIGTNAYDGGLIHKYLADNPSDIFSLKNKERIELDFQTLELFYEEVDIDTPMTSEDEWKIAFFNDKNSQVDFHFFRKTSNGIWYHKFGWNEAPTCLDDEGYLIENPLNARLRTDRYVYQTCYRLLKRRIK